MMTEDEAPCVVCSQKTKTYISANPCCMDCYTMVILPIRSMDRIKKEVEKTKALLLAKRG